MLAGALERRVWVRSGQGRIFPNLYVMLVAPPGIGKYVIEMARDLWQDACEPGTKLPAFRVASDSVTSASLVDELGKAKLFKILSEGPPYEYHSLLVAQEEFELFMPSYEPLMMGRLNSLYNNKNLHKESRRTGSVREVSIKNPQLNLLIGAQPAYLANTFPEEAWSTGMSRRLLMVYSLDTPLRSFWHEIEMTEELRKLVLRKLGALSTIFGQMSWTPESAARFDQLHMAGIPPAPGHSKLQHYLRSRSVNLAKLATISAISRSRGLVIELWDIDRGLDWMLRAEAKMPDIFRDMVGKSDFQVIEEMHLFVTALWSKNAKKPITGDHIMKFLLQRVPSEKAEKVLAMAERANIIARVAGTQDSWVPRPKFEHTVE